MDDGQSGLRWCKCTESLQRHSSNCNRPLEPLLSSLFTLWTTHVHVSRTMPKTQRLVAIVNSMVSLMSTRRPSLRTVYSVFIVALVHPLLVSLSTVDCTSACTTPSSLSFLSVLLKVAFSLPSCSAGLSPPVLVLHLTPSTPSVDV